MFRARTNDSRNPKTERWLAPQGGRQRLPFDEAIAKPQPRRIVPANGDPRGPRDERCAGIVHVRSVLADGSIGKDER
jgi:hypothetical protein